jgi:glycosyltransferase involved in cell wall biosynthesis
MRTAAIPRADGVLRLVYSGSVGGRYQLDKMARFIKVAMDSGVRVHLSILSRAERALVASILNRADLPDTAWSFDSVPHGEMPDRLASHHAGLHFLPQGISQQGGSPTKIGEYWATGLPVIVTPNISDTDQVIRNERVGVIVPKHSEGDYLKAIQELLLLLEDRHTRLRCRRAAERHYSLEAGCEKQIALYNSLIPGALTKGPIQEPVLREQRPLL